MIDQVRATPDDRGWTYHASPDALLRHRTTVTEHFIADYASGKVEGRHIEAELPTLPIADQAFYLALCSHLPVSSLTP